VVDWNTRASWDASYDIGGEPWGHPNTRPEVRLHYNRFTMEKAIKKRCDRMLERVPRFAQARDILIVGGGFGWAAEHFRDLGRNVVVTDISVWILDTQRETEEDDLNSYIIAAGQDPFTFEMIGPDGKMHRPLDLWGRSVKAKGDVVDEDLSTPGSRAAVRNMSPTDIVLTEGVLDGLEDPLPFIENIEQYRQNPSVVPIHFVAALREGENPFDRNAGWSWRTPTEWRTLLDDNGFNDHRLIDMSNLAEY
jgi:hypothetical protein